MRRYTVAVFILLISVIATVVTSPLSLSDDLDAATTGTLSGTNISYEINGDTLTISSSDSQTKMNLGSYNFTNRTGDTSNLITIFNDNNINLTSCKNIIVKDFTELPSYSFRHVTSIVSFSSDSVIQLGMYGVFQNCTSLKTVVLGEGTTSIGNGAFSNCVALLSVRSCRDADCQYSVHLDNVTDGGDGSFYQCGEIVSVHMSSMTRIGYEMFRQIYGDHSKLQSVTASEDLSYIGERGFWFAIKLVSLNGNDLNLKNVTYIGGVAFLACHSIKGISNLNIQTSGLLIDTFSDCPNISYISRTNEHTAGVIDLTGVKSLGLRCFNSSFTKYNGNDLKVLLGGVDPIDNSCFLGCSTIVKVKDYTPHIIEPNVFNGCKKLVSFNSDADEINLKGISSIGTSCFNGCSSLTLVRNIGLEIVSQSAFKECEKLNKLYGLDGLRLVGLEKIENDAFSGCKALDEVWLPDVVSIGESAFWNATTAGLSRLNSTEAGVCVLPFGLTSIGKNAFCNAIFEQIHVPSTVTEVGERAFTSNSLKELYLHDISNINSGTDSTVIADMRSTSTVYADEPTLGNYSSWFGTAGVGYVMKASATMVLRMQAGNYTLHGPLASTNPPTWAAMNVIDDGKIVLPYFSDSNGKPVSFGFGVGSSNPDSGTKTYAVSEYPGNDDVAKVRGSILSVDASSGDSITVHVMVNDSVSSGAKGTIYYYNGLKNDQLSSSQFKDVIGTYYLLLDSINVTVSATGYQLDEGQQVKWKYGQTFTLNPFSGTDVEGQYYTGLSNENSIYLRDEDKRSSDAVDHGILVSQTFTVGFWEIEFDANSKPVSYTISWYDYNGSLIVQDSKTRGSALGDAIDLTKYTIASIAGYDPDEIVWNTTSDDGSAVAYGSAQVNSSTAIYHAYRFDLRYTSPLPYHIYVRYSGNVVSSDTWVLHGPYTFSVDEKDGAITYTDATVQSRRGYIPSITGFSFNQYQVDQENGDQKVAGLSMSGFSVLGGTGLSRDLNLVLYAVSKEFNFSYYTDYGNGRTPLTDSYYQGLSTESYDVLLSGVSVSAPASSQSGFALSSVRVNAGGSSNGQSMEIVDNSIVLNSDIVSDADSYTVVFEYRKGTQVLLDFQNGTGIRNMGVISNGQILYTASATKTGYDFSRWQISFEGTDGVDFTGGGNRTLNLTYDEMLEYSDGANPVTFKIVWVPHEYSITFYNGPAASSDVLGTDSGYNVEEPKSIEGIEASYVGHRLSGWNVTIYPLDSEISAPTIHSQPDSNDRDRYTIQLTIELLEMYTSDYQIVAEAQWSEKTYTVEYDTNGSSDVIDPVEARFNTSVELPNILVAKAHSTLRGWSVGGDGTKLYGVGESFVVAGGIASFGDNNVDKKDTILVKAVWSDDVYTVIFDLNGGIGDVPDLVSGKYDVSLKWPDGTGFSREGYQYGGWALGKDDTYHRLNLDKINSELVQNAVTKNGTPNVITLYVKWEPQRYTIEYDYAGGSAGELAPKALYSGIEFTISVPLKTGSVFTGWSADHLGAGAKYRLGNTLVTWGDTRDIIDSTSFIDLTYVENDVVKLTAHWTPVDYTITYDLNSGEGTMPDRQYPLNVGASFVLASQAPTRLGYEFNGWSLDGVTPLGNAGATVSFSNAMASRADDADTVTLYAVWNPNSYTIHVVETDQVFYDVDAIYGESIDLVTPTRMFYSFDGWSIPSDQIRSSEAKYSTSGRLWVSWPTGTGTVNASYVMDLAVRGTIQLDAEWSAAVYNIEYDLNGGNGSTVGATAMIRVSDTSVIFPTSSAVSRDGYTLKGWSVNGTTVLASTDLRTMASSADSSGTVTLIAVWTPTNYTIHVVEVSGSVSYDVPAVYGESVSLGIPTRSSYTFTGWRIAPAAGETRSDDARYSASGTGQWIPWAANALANAGYVMDISLTSTITVQAVWEAKPITIEYDLNGGTGSTSSAASTVRITDTSVNLPTGTQVTRAGYTLRGWSVNGSTVLAATDVRTMVANADGNDIVTLKALWNSNSYIIHVTETDTLSYDVTAVYGESVYLGTPTRTYYTFSGWSIPVGQSRSDDARYSVSGGSLWIPWPNGASAVNAGYVMDLATTGTINVQATWTAVTYYIDYDLGGGTGSTSRASTTVRITDSSVTFPASTAVTRGGYTLGGWSVNGVTVLRSTDVPTIVRAVDTNDTVTLKAVWNSNSYTVHVVESDSVQYDVSAVYDESVNLGIPTRAYYTFAGWSIPANQSRSADARYSVSGDGWIPWPSGTSAVNAGYAIDLAYSGTITVQATWNADTYHIEYDLVGGKGSTDGASSTVKVTDASVTFPGDSVSRDGYTLRGWSVNGATVLEPTDVRTIVGAADDTGIVKLIAVWGSNTYTVHVVEVPDSIEYDVSAVYGESVSLGIPTRAYYTFAGWNIVPSIGEIQSGDARYSASGSGQWIPWPTDGTYVNAGYVMDLALSETIRVEAVWNAKSIYIEYDYNGGRGDTDGASATVRITDEKVTLPNATQITRQGYALNGWSLNGTVVLSDTDVSSIVRGADENDTVTLHAVWSTLDYTIRYRTLDTDDYVTVSATFDASLNLGTPTRQWYVFEGWLSTDVSTDTARYSQDGTNWMPWPTAEGSTVNGGYVMNLTSVSGGTVTLDAVWTAQDIYIEYNLNGGTGSTEQASSSVRITDERMTLPTAGQVSREGYSLAGWSLNGVTTIGEADVQTVVRASGSDGTVTLIAMWATVDYLVRYRALETDEYITVSATFDVPLNIGMPTRQGYTFAGWVSSDVSSGAARYSSDGSFWIPWPSQGIAARGGYVIDLTGTEGGTVTLDATWDLLMVNVDYDLNGGTGEVSGGSAQVHLGMEDFEFAQPGTAHRDGYAFSGWSLDRETVLDGFTDRMVLEADSNNRITLYAVWSANAYYIEYRSTEDAVYVRTQVYYDVSVEIGTPERVGYSFLGWSSTDVDTDQSRFSTNDVIWQEWPSEGYAYGGYVKNLSVEASGVVHLTAVWQKTVYTVTYDANGSSGAPPVDSATYTLDDPFTLASVSSLQGTNGKRIATGWALDQTATTGITVSSFVASLAEAADSFNNVTLYAVWIEGKYSVMVDIGDAKPSIVPTGWTLNSDGLYQREADYGSLTKDVLSDWDDTSFDWEGHKFTAWRYDISSVITDVTVTADFDEVHQWYLYAFVGVIIVIAIIAFAVTRMERW